MVHRRDEEYNKEASVDNVYIDKQRSMRPRPKVHSQETWTVNDCDTEAASQCYWLPDAWISGTLSPSSFGQGAQPDDKYPASYSLLLKIYRAFYAINFAEPGGPAALVRGFDEVHVSALCYHPLELASCLAAWSPWSQCNLQVTLVA